MICKVRGFTLNYRGSQKLIFSTMCDQICRPYGEPVFLEIPHFIKRDAKDHTYCSINKEVKVGVWQEGGARVWHISLWIPLNDLKVKEVRVGYKGRLEANNFTIANLRPIWTHYIFTWYVSAPKRLYQLAVYLLNRLNIGRNSWGNWSQWIGDVYCAFMLIWYTAT